ncbi:MAG TPA: hypothetical protein VMU33_13980 [Burkholderiaceae bacterium]|nr:hypothetical protein [Burkholderiaceae bacterium]
MTRRTTTGTGSLRRQRQRAIAASGVSVAALVVAMATAQAQTLPPLPPGTPPYVKEMWRSALSAPQPFGASPGVISPYLPQSFVTPDPNGTLGTYQTSGPLVTGTNPFFQSLGTNGRACSTCHIPEQGMGVSTAAIQQRFAQSGPRDPIFAPVDGANCPSAVSSWNTMPSHFGGHVGRGTYGNHQSDPYSLIMSRGVFRIFLPVPAGADYTIKVVHDPYGCNTDPTYAQTTDETGKVTQIISVYRRPKVSTNLPFVTVNGGNIMWDGREPTLRSQALDATRGHAQATQDPTDDQLAQIVAFESQFFSGQQSVWPWLDLTSGGAQGGPKFLSTVTPTGLGTGGGPPPARGTSIFNAWSTVTGSSPTAQMQQSIYRGQQIFNNTTFQVTNVDTPGPNFGLDGFNPPGSGGTCTSCHGQPQSGDDLIPQAQHDIGVSGDNPMFGGPVPQMDLPIFQVTCTAAALLPPTTTGGFGPPPVNDLPAAATAANNYTVYTNDPGLALISGHCADVGRSTVPNLRGMASRAPFFHDGSAQTMMDVVNFYNKRFAIGLTAQQKQDLVNFLNAL